MTERVCAPIGQKIAEKISQIRSKSAEKSFKIRLKGLCINVLRSFFESFFYCEKKQKITFKKVLTSQLIEFIIRLIEKQQTKNRQ